MYNVLKEKYLLPEIKPDMSRRKKIKKLKHIYKDRGKGMDKINFKKFCRELTLEEFLKVKNGMKHNQDEKNKKEYSESENGRFEEKIIDENHGFVADKPDTFNQLKDVEEMPEVEIIDPIKTEPLEEPSNDFDNNDFNNELYNNISQKKLNSKVFYGNIEVEIHRRQILPEINETNYKIFELPELKCCLIEHNYFKRNRTDSVIFQDQTKINLSALGTRVGPTLPFQNRIEPDENRTKQQQMKDLNDSIIRHVNSVSFPKIFNNSSSFGKSSVNKNIRKNLSSGIYLIDKKNELNSAKFSTSESHSTKSPLLDGNGNSENLIWEDNNLMTRSSCSSNIDFNKYRCQAVNLNNIDTVTETQDSNVNSDHSNVGDRIITLDEIDREITEMEKIIKSKCEMLYEERKKKENLIQNTDTKDAENLLSKLRKIVGKEDNQDSLKEKDYLLSMPNATKMIPEDKNWNLEYTEDDAKNLGLDDLLLRASELNAENFTKALGQNSANRNGTKTDASDIVLSFPNSKRNSDELKCKDSEIFKGVTAKKTKLDFCKRYVKEDVPKAVPEEESAKKVAEASPKRPGIKVKTVQNINEEFNDSLGGKLKNFEGRDIMPDPALTSQQMFGVGDHGPKNGKELFISEAREQITNNSSSLLNTRIGKLSKLNDQGKSSMEEFDEDRRPFIMTLMQNKEAPAKEHIPAILRNSKALARAKSIRSENRSYLTQLEERRNENMDKKKDANEAVDVRSGTENVTVLVSEPRTSRPFEVVNVNDYVPEVNGVHGKSNTGFNSHYVVHYRNGSFFKKKDINGDGNILKHSSIEGGIPISCRKKNIPFILNNSKKYLRVAPPINEKPISTSLEDGSRLISSSAQPLTKTTLSISDQINSIVNCEKERASYPTEKATFSVTSTEQKIGAKETGGRFFNLLPYESSSKGSGNKEDSTRQDDQAYSSIEDVENERRSCPKQTISLMTFTTILKDILPDKWVLSLDRRYGLQIIKTHLDELLNPSLTISVVVGRTGRVTVNVRGRQLEKSHDLFKNLCDVANSNEKISINYILSILNKLRFFSVCFGCDDLSLKKYWCEDGFIEYYTEFQQTYRSHICELLVRLGKKRCYPCYRMHESLKKRKRREQLMKKNAAEGGKVNDAGAKGAGEAETSGNSAAQSHVKGMKRSLEEFLEESFMTMKQKIADEIEKAKEDEEGEKVPKTQDEVLSFMGLTRKDSLDVNLRKSKREKKGFKKCESVINSNVNKEELYFLEKYWPDINVLFSTSLLIGAYSRTSMARLREKCRMFHKLLATWRAIFRDNHEWIGGHINLAENLIDDEESMNEESTKEKFEKMDIIQLRTYIINSVKEVNRIKIRLRTKNTYFRLLYNTFIKPRLKKTKPSPECNESRGEKMGEVAASKYGTNDEASQKREEAGKPLNPTNATPSEVESCGDKDEDSQCNNAMSMICVSDVE